MNEFLKSLLIDNIYRKIENHLEEQVKFTGTKFDNKGDDYPLSATALLSPAYIGIEELPHMPFLSLYLQLGATRCKIEEVLKNYQTDDDETRENFIKKIRIDDNNDVSNAEIIAFRKHFQMPLALFGLSSNIYSFLKQFISNLTTSSLDLTSSFKQLLTA
ncbi:4133_t:CDS:2 [Funneliformis caledonium]|uniref:4133_t:CDS:1 n=1 Tax=Funneliformis caledonium TaxID=1117310 RepID=A0A9N8ZK43_9GLOM|nr:4133_t:CDS:2 [Funneliformis caledonium]